MTPTTSALPVPHLLTSTLKSTVEQLTLAAALLAAKRAFAATAGDPAKLKTALSLPGADKAGNKEGGIAAWRSGRRERDRVRVVPGMRYTAVPTTEFSSRASETKSVLGSGWAIQSIARSTNV